MIGIVSAIASSAIFGLPAAPFIAAGAGLGASAAVITGAELLKSDCASANTTCARSPAMTAGSTRVTGQRRRGPEP